MSDPQDRACPGRCENTGNPVWCRPCERQARAALTELDRLATWMEQMADGFRPRTPGFFISGGSVEIPSPSPATDVVDRVYADLRDFEAMWRERQGYAPTRRTTVGRTAHDRAVTIAFLMAHLDAILNDRKMVVEIQLILRWRTVLQHMTRAAPERTERPGRCPRCHMVNVLYTDHQTGNIQCRECPVEMTDEEYQEEVISRTSPADIAESRRKARADDQTS